MIQSEELNNLLKQERDLEFLLKSEPAHNDFNTRVSQLEEVREEISQLEETEEIDTTDQEGLVYDREETETEDSDKSTHLSSREKADDRYRKAVHELERVFSYFNNKFTHNTLPDNVLITIQSRGRRKNSLGWFSPDQWTQDGATYSEINISAEVLASKGVHELVNTMLHEMTHLKCFQEEIKDVSVDGYHNKKFKEVAESFGLVVEKSKYYGYSQTKLGDGVKESLKILQIDTSVFTTTRVEKPIMIDDKYDNLLVRKAFKPVIKNFSEMTGLTMLDLVEEAIHAFMKDYK